MLEDRLEASDVGEQSAMHLVIVGVHDLDFDLAQTSLELCVKEASLLGVQIESHQAAPMHFPRRNGAPVARAVQSFDVCETESGSGGFSASK